MDHIIAIGGSTAPRNGTPPAPEDIRLEVDIALGRPAGTQETDRIAVDREIARERCELANKHVAGKKRIEGKTALLTKLKRDGHDTIQARALLEQRSSNWSGRSPANSRRASALLANLTEPDEATAIKGNLTARDQDCCRRSRGLGWLEATEPKMPSRGIGETPCAGRREPCGPALMIGLLGRLSAPRTVQATDERC
jgi:hypothetical protein